MKKAAQHDRYWNSRRFHNNVGSLGPSRLWLLDDQRLAKKEPNMLMIGVDYHPSDQHIAFIQKPRRVASGD